jgi:hypothetical protein
VWSPGGRHTNGGRTDLDRSEFFLPSNIVIIMFCLYNLFLIYSCQQGQFLRLNGATGDWTTGVLQRLQEQTKSRSLYVQLPSLRYVNQ